MIGIVEALIGLLLVGAFCLAARSRRAAAATRAELCARVADLAEMKSRLEETRTALERRECELEQQRRAALHIAADAREAQRKAEEAEQQAALAVESAPNAMVMIDASGQIVLVNAEAERIFGYSRAELLGERVEALIPERFRGIHPELRDGFFASPQTRAMGAGRDLFAVRSDGSEFPVEIGLNPIETSRGRFVLSAIVDNTERKRTADELQRRTEEMEQLLHTVSHDLKSPLVTIQGFAGLIGQALERSEAECATDAAERVMRGTRTMGALIDDLLKLSRIETEEKLVWVEVEELVNAVRDALDAQFARADAELRIETDLPRIWTAPNRLYQIFSNLIENALKYGCEKAGARIDVGFRDAPRHYEFYVRDRGPGIAESHHERIFVIFRRLSGEREGSGLGLAIVMKAARSLGGRAWLDSALGRGATFWFSVAKHRAAHDEIDAGDGPRD